MRALSTTLDEAKRLGAMALFNEKYGDIVRMVEVGDGSFSRELCGGTHVRNTAEIGLFRVTAETSSAANVRRIEAITGPEAVGFMRDARPRAAARRRAAAGPRRAGRRHDRAAARPACASSSGRSSAARAGNGERRRRPAGGRRAIQASGASVLAAAVTVADGDALLQLADRLKGKLGDAAIVLGRAGDGRVDLVASVAPALVARGVRAGEIVKAAAAVVGGGGGGRDTLARAGGRDPERLPEAISAAQAAIEAALDG